MCVALSCAWLFSLSYMLAIVHSEYQELNIDLKKCKYQKYHSFYCAVKMIDEKKTQFACERIVNTKIVLESL